MVIGGWRLVVPSGCATKPTVQQGCLYFVQSALLRTRMRNQHKYEAKEEEVTRCVI